MRKFAFLLNNEGYKKYTALAAVNAGASIPRIRDGIEKKIFELHNAEPLNRFFELPLKCIWFKKCIDHTKLDVNDEILFVLYESFHMSYSQKLIKYIKKTYPKSKCLFFFTNPVGEYNLGRVKKIKAKYDMILTFNREDSKKYGFTYCPYDLFELPKSDIVSMVKSDLFFVGANKGRLDILLRIYEKAVEKGLICDFWIDDVPLEEQKYAGIIHYNQRLSYEEVLRHDRETRCIVEILQDGKQYNSIRTMEALQFGKKLYTMNASVEEQWFYDPDIIHVFRNDDINLDFVRSEVSGSSFEKADIGSFQRFSDYLNYLLEGKMEELNTVDDLYRGGLFLVIKSDLARLCQPTFSNFLKVYLLPRGTVFRFNVWFRILQWSRTSLLKKIFLGPIAYLFMRHYEYKYGIHANANIYVGKGLHIKHGDGVHLNCRYIGENFTCYQGVTLGAKHGEVPTVLDDVTVYTNSVVCGGIVLKKGSVVGAQSYLDKDVEEGGFVKGVPAHSVSEREK